MLDQRRQAHGHAGCLVRPTWPRPGAGGGSESVSSRHLAAEKRATQTGGPAKLVAIAQKRSIGIGIFVGGTAWASRVFAKIYHRWLKTCDHKYSTFSEVNSLFRNLCSLTNSIVFIYLSNNAFKILFRRLLIIQLAI